MCFNSVFAPHYVYNVSLASLLCFHCVFTARSREDETRNGHQNAQQNPNRNQETTVVSLFSNVQMKRDIKP